MGNWEETNDELRNDIADLEDDNAELEKENEELRSALNAADDDIANYLFELDHLHSKRTEAELDSEALLMLVEYWQGKADEFEVELADSRYKNTEAQLAIRDLEQEVDTLQREKRHDAAAALTVEGQAMENYVRVNELTKENQELELQLDVITGAKTFWMNAANKFAQELIEMKAALRTLGGEKES